VEVGLERATRNVDSVMIKDNQKQLQHILELLKFVLTVNDEEIVKSTLESIIELLEEEISK
jgi:Asp-tRNA(Asn)/Glu-tRNA(Gln) amidotransferase C subunit